MTSAISSCCYVRVEGLPSLKEIQSYIKTNKPEVPSAKEMEMNGINLGEMNLLLLKKVEELTLYAISQDASLREVREQNIALQERIQRLEKKRR